VDPKGIPSNGEEAGETKLLLSSDDEPLKRRVVSWERLDKKMRENSGWGDQAEIDGIQQHRSNIGSTLCTAVKVVASSESGMLQ